MNQAGKASVRKFRANQSSFPVLYRTEYHSALSLPIGVASLTNLFTPLGLLQACSAALVATCNRLFEVL